MSHFVRDFWKAAVVVVAAVVANLLVHRRIFAVMMLLTLVLTVALNLSLSLLWNLLLRAVLILVVSHTHFVRNRSIVDWTPLDLMGCKKCQLFVRLDSIRLNRFVEGCWRLHTFCDRKMIFMNYSMILDFYRKKRDRI